MLRMIFKMMAARKRRYGWLVTELVLVSVVVWGLLDPVVVLSSIESMPDGFDRRNLYCVTLAEYSADAPRYQSPGQNFMAARENMWRLLEKVRRYEGVESATFLGATAPYSQSSVMQRFRKDTLETEAWGLFFVPGSDYFKTFRFDEVDGQTNEELDRLLQHESDGTAEFCVISEAAFPGQSVKGWVDTVYHHRIVGTTSMVRMRGGGVPMPVATVPVSPNNSGNSLLVRVRDGVDESDFLPAFTEWARKQLRAGNYYVRGVQTYEDIIEKDMKEVHQHFRVRSILGVFFLFCLFLGVTGTFWMQTRSRREEIGIMKSFGATRKMVMRIFLIEGFVLTTLAVAVACFLYLQYALKEGLYNPLPNSGNNLNILGGARFWFEHFQQHFTVISLLTWVLLLVVVCIGIYLPARGICRIPPTDALREE